MDDILGTGNGAFAATTQSFLTSLTINAVAAGAQLAIFLGVRHIFKAVYEPRTYIPPRADQAKPFGKGILSPLLQIAKASEKEILKKNGVDPYVFVRFLRMLAKALVPIWLLSWAILLPVNSVHSVTLDHNGKPRAGLDKFTFGNIAANLQSRYWAHLVLTYLFNAWWLYLVWMEMKHWLKIRQRYLISPSHSRLAQASTVLITSIPKSYMDEKEIEKLFSYLPGGVKRVWLNRDLKEMPDLWKRRLNACSTLETAQVNLIKSARKRQAGHEKEIEKKEAKHQPVPGKLARCANSHLGDADDLALVDRLVPRKERPTMRLKPSWSPIGLGWLGIGEKVDTIEWARKEIAECNVQLNTSREKLRADIDTPGVGDETYQPLSSAFIRFNQQIAAHMARQCVAYNQPYKMNRRFIEQAPENVNWGNMGLNSYEYIVRKAISYGITFGMLILWSIPVAFIGAMATVNSLVEKVPWLEWIKGESMGKKILQGVITGVLPPVLLALLMMILPMLLRKIATHEGLVSKTEVELNVMTRYFVFLVIHSFLIITLATGILTALPALAANPTSIANTLAENLPSASTFFITRILLQFAGVAGVLLQPINLALYYIMVILGGGSPRSVYKSRYRMPSPDWGADFPNMTIYAVIMISYMTISPIINGFGACFSIFAYAAYKYQYIWVQNQPYQTDTGGLFFPKAITHVFVGLYIQEICLCALFFLARDEANDVSALPQAILMIILIVLTAGVQYIIRTAYGPLIQSLPLSLAHLSYGMPKGEGHENSIDGGNDVKKVRGSEETGSDAAAEADDGNGNSINEKAPQNGSPQHATEDLTPTPEHANSSEEVRYPPKPLSQYSGVPPSANTASTESHYNPATQTWEGSPPKQSHEHLIERAEMGYPLQSVISNNPADEDDHDTQFLAVPGGPGLMRFNFAEDEGPDAFLHPATKDPQPIIWLPRDELGLACAEVEINDSHDVKSTDKGAVYTNKGKIRITGMPPDYL